MRYKYQRTQIFRKKLDLPKDILFKVYNCTLLFSEFIEYKLDDKIPITCLDVRDRQIVEKFGLEKAKQLDWELLDYGIYNGENDLKKIIMSFDENIQNLNETLYEMIKDQMKPSDYSSSMKEFYKDRILPILEGDSDDLRSQKWKFNHGELSLKELIFNWDLYKDKDLSYCLIRDRNNEFGISDNQLKQFMGEFDSIAELILLKTNIYTFISEINNSKSEFERKKVIKKVTDSILDTIDQEFNNSSLTNEQYSQLFKYSSIEEYLKKNSDEMVTNKILSELKYLNLSEFHLLDISIPFSILKNRNVLSFLSEYGLKNVIEFDDECGHFFTKNNYEMLKNMYSLYLHYATNNPDTRTSIITKGIYSENNLGSYNPYTKDEFYEAIRRMVVYGPSDSTFADKCPDYRDITGDFRIRNPELFISDQSPEELKKTFYTKSITPQLLVKHPEYIEYLNGKNLESCFKSRNIEIRKSDSYLESENLYHFISENSDFNTTIKFITDNSDALEIIFDKSRFLFPRSLSSDLVFSEKSNYNEILKQFKNIINSGKFKAVTEFLKIPDVELKDAFREYVLECGNDIDTKKVQYASDILSKLLTSNSSEIFAFRKELAPQILKSDNPFETFDKIESLFVKNNIPTVGKIYSCFDILHPDFKGFNFDNSMISPVLKSSTLMGKNIVIFSDLIKCSFGSNNRSVNDYLNNIDFASKLYESIRKGQIQYDELDQVEKDELLIFSRHLATLYNNTLQAKKMVEEVKLTGSVMDNLLELSKKMSPNGTLDYNLGDRVIRMFCGFAGINTLSQAKEYIYKKITTVDEKNRNAAGYDMILEQGDFIKGIGSVNYLKDILQNGSISKEYLGASAGSDFTPLDTDVSMIITNDRTISDKINSTAANSYGPIWFVLKNDDRFMITRDSNRTFDAKKDMTKMEVFYTGVVGKDHYGIRTGFASSEINYVVMEDYDSRVGLEIAMNGFYIPVADKNGKIIFTPNDYDKLREKMSGLSYYGENNYVFSNNLITEDTQHFADQVEKYGYEIHEKREKITAVIKKSLGELDLQLKTYMDGDLTEGIVELIDTGSTGRGTNKLGDGDFDFMMRLDKSILSDSCKVEQLKKKMLKNFGKDGSSELTADGDFRLKNVEIDAETIVDIDITFDKKTDKVSYSTDMALQDRLSTIKKIDPKKYKYVVANILLAKEVLKQAGVYKPNRGETPQGGLGGVGIENWILQNGGSFVDAATDFIKMSVGKNFSEFKDSYYIWDFGENHLASRRGKYPHDNFVSSNMSEDGYNKMVQVLNTYINNVKLIDYNGVHK